jgi:hypothetical protein
MSTSYALRPAWTPLTILLMIVGFIVFWPLGLAMLAYILFGDRVPEIRKHFSEAGENMKREWNGFRGCDWNASRTSYGFSASGNAAFDEYREKELKRLEEERRRLDEERREFEGYVRDLRRARDKEEFDRFMRERSDRRGGETGETGKTIDL